MTDRWLEVRDRTRLWCKIDPPRCLLQIVHRGKMKIVDLTAYGLVFVGQAEVALPCWKLPQQEPMASGTGSQIIELLMVTGTASQSIAT